MRAAFGLFGFCKGLVVSSAVHSYCSYLPVVAQQGRKSLKSLDWWLGRDLQTKLVFWAVVTSNAQTSLGRKKKKTANPDWCLTFSVVSPSLFIETVWPQRRLIATKVPHVGAT